MEFFTLIRKHFVMCGIEISQKSTKRFPINVQNASVFILVCVTITLAILSLNGTSSFDERTDIWNRACGMGTCAFVYMIIIWESPALFKFIDDLDETINASKWNYYLMELQLPTKMISNQYFEGLNCSESRVLYAESSQRMGKWIKILHVAFIQISPAVSTGSALIVSFSKYYTTDLGSSAFELPLPMW